MSSISTPYIAQVQRVFSDRGGRVVKVTCPFLCGSAHEHPWPKRDKHPSREVLAPCARPGELLTYAIDPVTAQAAVTAGKNASRQHAAAKR